MKAAHSLCTATVSTVDIKKQPTDRSKELTAWSRVLLERLTRPQLFGNSHVMEPEVSSPHSQELATCPCREPDENNPILIPLLDKPF